MPNFYNCERTNNNNNNNDIGEDKKNPPKNSKSWQSQVAQQ